MGKLVMSEIQGPQGPGRVRRPAGRAAVSPPVRVRLAMTLAAWLVAFAVVMLLLALFGDLLAALPMAGRAAVISGVLVTVMVNLVMPRLAGLVNRWAASGPVTAPAGSATEPSDREPVHT
ncbi:hypothetical protein [Actinomadura sp. NPDC000600]|uniref:hypothetical protein n=1 Tax=Actinomadura sp. NPDC000600 TaxID=3154262 RepID=UPI00339ADAF1